MAKVSLRIYNQEIESMVEGGRLDEAIAHCRHILNTYPKHLETYRLIGKAYLEAKRYDEATDIFERVLMAVPDDFVAHVGMSIIRDEQKNMDAAIWHMQRAFEVQPSNAAIQSELQRLYGRRDGVEPPKIRLTRGALAHMYVQGELYPQAISEINAVLEEDRERQDMQVLLARAYFHGGQKSEAAEICSQLIRRYPYCFEANRVLVELLPQTEQGESVQAYRKRVNELDPYSAFVTGSIFHTEEVPDAAVSLERLEWDGQPVDMGPEWGETQGIGLSETPSSDDGEPDWLKNAMTSEGPGDSTQGEPASVSEGLPVPTPSAGDDEIPEFLRAAGWGEDTGTFQENQSIYDDSTESDEDVPLAEGDLPEWVKAMAPAGAADEIMPPQMGSEEDLTNDDVPDWLQGIGDAQSAPSKEKPLEKANLPDWLAAEEPAEDMTPAQGPEEQPMAEPSSDDDLPDWLKSMQEEEEQVVPQETAPEIPQEPVQEIAEMGDESLSDWQIGDEESKGPVDFDKTDTGELGTTATEQDDAIAWLEGLASKHGAKPEELVTDPNARSETEPDWVQQAKATKDQIGADEPAAQEPTPEVGEPVSQEQPAEAPADLPDFLAEEQVAPEQEPAAEADAIDVSSLGTSAEEQDDAVAWLESLASKHGAKPEELVTDPNARSETEPEWVQKAKATADQVGAETPADLPDFLAEEQAGPEEEPIPEGDAPVAQEQPDAETPVESMGESAVDVGALGTSAEEQDDAVAWLESLASKHGAKPEELVTDPEARKETAPEWVQKASEAGAEQGTGERPTAPPPEDFAEEEQAEMEPAGQMDKDLVAALEEAQGEESAPTADTDETGMWLQELEQEAAVSEEQDEATQVETPAMEDDVPAWLREMESDASPAEAASTSGDDASLPDWLKDMDSGPAETESAPPPAPEEAAPEPVLEAPEKLDINAASIDELAELPGIGELLAQNIVAHRETYGEFSSIDDLSNVAGIGEATIDDLRGQVEVTEQPGITDWLQTVDVETFEMDTGEPTADETAEDDFPSWLAGLDEEGEQEQSAVPSDDLPEWLRAEAEGEPVLPEPTVPTDWRPADAGESESEVEPEEAAPVAEPEPEEDEPTVQAALEPETEEPAAQTPPPTAPQPEPEPAPLPGRPAYQEPITRSRSGMTGMLSPAQDPALTEAQNELTRGNIPGAMENYGKLIKKGKLLEEIIFDLREALYRYPVEVTILQTLGDAYMRANRLQEALDAYTKAEELLR